MDQGGLFEDAAVETARPGEPEEIRAYRAYQRECVALDLVCENVSDWLRLRDGQ